MHEIISILIRFGCYLLIAIPIVKGAKIVAEEGMANGNLPRMADGTLNFCVIITSIAMTAVYALPCFLLGFGTNYLLSFTIPFFTLNSSIFVEIVFYVLAIRKVNKTIGSFTKEEVNGFFKDKNSK